MWVGSTVGNYVVRQKVGEGGMGVVYLAEHPRITKRVAIKVLNPASTGERSDVVGRFLNEARAASEIRSEHVIDILDFGELPDGSPYLVMEWLEGEPFSRLLSRGLLSLDRGLHILRGIGAALTAAHQRGVVHRDLKPDNVFIIERHGDPDFVKVLDFGIAKLAHGDGNLYRTATGALIGTPAYMSPEQCRGLRSIDHRSDVYSMGVIAYQVFTGRLPFEAEGLGDLLLAHLSQSPPPPGSLVGSLPTPVSDAIMRALAKSPDDRFDSTAAFLAALAGDATEAPAPPATQVLPAPSEALPPRTQVLPPAPSSAGPPHQTTLSHASAEIRPAVERPRAGRARVLAAAAAAAAGLSFAGWLLLGGHRGAPTISSSPPTPPSHAGAVPTPAAEIPAPPATPAPATEMPPAPRIGATSGADTGDRSPATPGTEAAPPRGVRSATRPAAIPTPPGAADIERDFPERDPRRRARDQDKAPASQRARLKLQTDFP
jgi:serine/threonine protein kinase